jgi:hypothetical protein
VARPKGDWIVFNADHVNKVRPNCANEDEAVCEFELDKLHYQCRHGSNGAHRGFCAYTFGPDNQIYCVEVPHKPDNMTYDLYCGAEGRHAAFEHLKNNDTVIINGVTMVYKNLPSEKDNFDNFKVQPGRNSECRAVQFLEDGTAKVTKSNVAKFLDRYLVQFRSATANLPEHLKSIGFTPEKRTALKQLGLGVRKKDLSTKSV